MIKWPEPVACYSAHRGMPEGTNEFFGYADATLPPATRLYTEAQLKQAVRDALEQAAKVAQETVCDTHTPTGINVYGTRAAKAIRALIEEIE